MFLKVKSPVNQIKMKKYFCFYLLINILMSTVTSVTFGFDLISNLQLLFANSTFQLHLIIVKLLLDSFGGTEKKN